MAQPGDGSASLEKAAEEGPVVSTQPGLFSRAESISSSTVTPAAKHEAQAGEDATDPEDALFAHLPEHEKQELKRQLESPDVKASFATLYRYASRMDILIMLVSAICAIAAGAALPLFTVSLSMFPGLEETIWWLNWMCAPLDSFRFSGFRHAK